MGISVEYNFHPCPLAVDPIKSDAPNLYYAVNTPVALLPATMTDVPSLLKLEEGPKCDFKRQSYRLPEEKAELAKDIAALANSTRRHEGDSLLIIGFDRSEATFRDVQPLIQQGEAQIQQMVNSLVDPPIRFAMETITHRTDTGEGRFVVFRVPQSTRKPHLVKRDVPVAGNRRSLSQGQCFVRRGSNTEIATREEISEIVHDADGTFSPLLRLMRYVQSVQRSGHQVDVEEIKRLLVDDDLIPSFYAPLQTSLSYVATNSSGEHITRSPISAEAAQAQTSLVSQAIGAADAGDFALALVLFKKIPAVQESVNACVVGATIHTRLGEREAAEALIQRALELEPDLPEVNVRAAEFSSRFEAEGECLIYCERGLERIAPNTHVDIVKQLHYLAGTTYHAQGIANRARAAMTRFLELHQDEDDCRSFARSIVEGV